MPEEREATPDVAAAPLVLEDEIWKRCKGIVFAFAAGGVLSIRMVGDLALV